MDSKATGLLLKTISKPPPCILNYSLIIPIIFEKSCRLFCFPPEDRTPAKAGIQLLNRKIQTRSV